MFLKIAGFNNPYIDLRNNNFLNLKEVDDLFNCDIFCISEFQNFHQLPFEEYKQLKIRIHINIGRYFLVGSTLPGSCEDIINLGIVIISTISGLITIFDFLKKKYFKNNPLDYIFRMNMNSKIKINLFIKKTDDIYKLYDFSGNLDDLYSTLMKDYLREINLEETDLFKANFMKTKLIGVNLKKAYLAEANFEKTELMRANLEEAILFNANLKKAYLEGANLEGSNLEGANLEEAILFNANLKKVNLKGANLKKAYLEGSNLEGANLEGANLEEAILFNANLKKVNLKGANLKKAYLKGVNLEGAIY